MGHQGNALLASDWSGYWPLIGPHDHPGDLHHGGQERLPAGAQVHGVGAPGHGQGGGDLSGEVGELPPGDEDDY